MRGDFEWPKRGKTHCVFVLIKSINKSVLHLLHEV
jgi:hypothetical protein